MAVLTYLRHDVVDLMNVSIEHLTAAAFYFGLDGLHQMLIAREPEGSVNAVAQKLDHLSNIIGRNAAAVRLLAEIIEENHFR